MISRFAFDENRQNRKVAKKIIFFFAVISMVFIVKEFGNVETTVTNQYSVGHREATPALTDTDSLENVYESGGIVDFKPPEGTGAEGEFLNGPEIMIPASERKPDSDIRYAAFGSSSTWGASLKHREEECYVWRLSDQNQERGKNFAIRASGPNYPATCLSTMIGDDHLDVIVLEYYMMAESGLDKLARRARERFPDAIIVILRLWAPDRIWKNGSAADKVHKWAFKNGFQGGFTHNEDFKKTFLETAGDGWDFFPEGRYKKEFQENVASEVGAYIVSMPFNEKADGPDGWLDIADHFLGNDSFHMSDKGHFWIYTQVKAIVDRVGVPKNPRVGEFSMIDQCYNWLLTGTLDESVEYSSSGSIVKMPRTEKYSLEFKDEGRDKNWILLENKSNEVMNIALGYMTTGPPPSKYPAVEAKRSDGERFVLDPNSSDAYGDKEVHISKSVDLGTIAPLSTLRIFFNPEEESEWPFRLVQIMVTPRDEGAVASE